MTHSIRNGIGNGMGNSLSPEPCALCPAELRSHANLTVGAHDAPAISRPDVADVGMPIEHLDWQPPCDARLCNGERQAEVIAHTNTVCDCIPSDRLWCLACLARILAKDAYFASRGITWFCFRCRAVMGNPWVKRWEPLR